MTPAIDDRHRASSSARTGGGRAGTGQPEGVITGYLFKLIRESADSALVAANGVGHVLDAGPGLTQEQLAERLGVDKNTIQGWESGRRPLARTPAVNLVSVRRRLLLLGANPQLVDALDNAMEADLFLSQAVANDPAHENPAAHPLASWVMTRDVSEMLAWPFTGTRPAVAQSRRLDSRRRGPVPEGPTLTRTERERFFAHLHALVERSHRLRSPDAPAAALLRRQAYFMAAWDQSAIGRAWLAEMSRRDQRYVRDLGSWSPMWVAARSIATAGAMHGDREQLWHFVRNGLASDQCEAANLNYYAYWHGEEQGAHTADDFMASPDLGAWRGTRLLGSLTDKLTLDTPYVDMCVHTVWSLVRRRPYLLSDDPVLTGRLGERTEQLVAVEGLSAQSRKELEQVHFAVRMTLDSVRQVRRAG